MKSLYFNIGTYSFSNKIKKLLKYLNENSISHSIDEKKITYSIILDGIKIECTGYIYKNRITNLQMYSNSCSNEEIESLKKKVTSRYVKKHTYLDSNVTCYTPYPKVGFALEIILSDFNEFFVNVCFEDETHKLFDHKARMKKIREIIIILTVALLGLGFSILFLSMYYNESNITSNVITGIISYFYMSISILVLCKLNDEESRKTLLYMFLLPIIYVAIAFIALLLLGDNKNMILEYLFWAIYSMPAFIIVVVVVLLLMAAASYA